ncbi:homoserine O-acetyltransferase [Basidiobolus meristosporus CBS 931.73]|uniref:Homoserine O-acetyltransferase n=1 Tax=Basidiobolus meristosporus CBS 931.73 TaxID=1314790 RepID=A0A1Y1Z6B3_9FUNG|nr:homoserine O-acetyltransferase [Basidiobolus meristosporus CBS 931.73]|eukprot:ORY05780.1 homoserine O-acetyltransferase [Basidiobolus meristosporus CBS 931.73]
MPHFPCLERLENRTRSLLDMGPEPAYQNVITGYKTYHHSRPFLCDHGGVLREYDLAYETWGTLNEKKDNVILLHTGLSASSHAKSHAENPNPGWWEKFIGPGLAIDTNHFFVICTNVIGGCYGSSGPSSIDPNTNERYATRFPILTIFDMIRAQFHLLDHLGIDKLYASVGASMGGMQSIAAASLFPERVSRVISISGCARSHPYSIALRHTQRQVLMSDPSWNRGFYYDGIPPHIGMKLARQIATITYRSGPEWEQRFARKRFQEDQIPSLCPDFLIETYLDHQGEKFCLQYDANSLLYISKAMDMFDMSASAVRKLQEKREANAANMKSILADNEMVDGAGFCLTSARTAEDSDFENEDVNLDVEKADLIRGMSRINMPILVLGVQSDILFPSWQQKEIADSIRAGGNKSVTYYELDSLYGHDTFLIDRVGVGAAVKGHLENSVV